MIYVDRSRVPVPKTLFSARAEKARAAARAYFSVQRKNRLQTRFEFDPSLWKESADALAELFRHKCAYCEQPYVRSSGSYLDHFRPKDLAVDLPEGLTAASNPPAADLPDGYWWLAYDWENLYHVCPTCNRNKRNIFPVDGPRAKPGAMAAELRSERAFLLDPCFDSPEEYLRFKPDGVVDPVRHYRTRMDRGRITIEVLGLNRPDLVQQRKMAAEEVLHGLRILGARAAEPRLAKAIFDPAKPFLALRRDVAHAWGLGPQNPLTNQQREQFVEDVRRLFLGPGERQADIFERITKEASSSIQGLAAPFNIVKSKRGYIQSIEIENFRAIEHLKIEIPTGTPDRVGWMVLLGENGAGKSSVLQAVALTLLGERASEFSYRPERMLRKLPKTGGLAKKGVVRVQLSSASEPVEMRFSLKGITYSQPTALPADLVLRGYGPTRLMPRRGRRHVPKGRKLGSKPPSRNEARNLFDPFQPVCDANAWLNSLDSKEAFASAALTLKDLLRIPQKTWLNRDKGSVIVPLDGLKITLDELSAGYESILVLAVDIMSAVHGSAHDMRQAAGIVLLDEIDAHLHPRWKMEIVGALRRSFPLMQFLATTHEPLCLRGLDEGEVNVMRRVGGLIVLEDNLPSSTGLRVDQLLTSQFFGLHSTIEPELDNKFVEYYSLLAKHDTELSAEQRNRLEELRRELSGVGVLGHTRRDQIIYEVIDEYLAKEPLLASKDERLNLKAETKKRISELLAEVSAPTETPS